MAQFRTTADIIDSVLRRAGEPTNGNSAYESDALEYLNRVHHNIIAGGSVLNLDVDETWVWARSKFPMTIELQPSIREGTVSVTLGSEAGTFSSAPTSSVEGWFLKVDGRSETYEIVQHTAGASAFELDAAYIGGTDATAEFRVYKLDYVLSPSYLVVDSTNNKIDFNEENATVLTATVAVGSYTPDQLATAVKTAMDTAGASTYTVTYDSVKQLFTIASDRSAGDNVFLLKFATGTSIENSIHPLLGYDDSDLTDAASHASLYPLGGISRLIEPFRSHRTTMREALIYGVENMRFMSDFPVHLAAEGLPSHFTRIEHSRDGIVKVRFNKYPAELKKIEVYYVPMPRDLKDNTASRPLLPRRDIDTLEYGAAYYLMLDKEDSKAQTYLALAQQGLKSMEKRNRSELRKLDNSYGEIITRPEQLERNVRFRYGYTAED